MGDHAIVSALRDGNFAGIGVLFLATHGLVGDESISKLPAVIMTPDPRNSSDDGVFDTSEIVMLNLDGIWLAVIAACRTANAAPSDVAEGLSGLGLAFTAAGARALLLSYWDVEQIATHKLLGRTFEFMDEDPSLSVSRALDKAMTELRDNPKYDAPERWAPFVVIGDGTLTLPKK